MTTDVLTGSTLNLWAKVVSGIPKGSSATFILLKDGSPVKRERGSVEQGDFADGERAVFAYEIPEDSVPQNSDNYQLEFVVEVDGREFVGSDDFRVWPRKIGFKAVDRDGLPVDRFPFRLSEAGQGNESEWITGNDGTAECTAEFPVKMEIEAAEPHEILEWSAGKEKGHQREAKVKLLYRPALFPIEEEGLQDTSATGSGAKGKERKIELSVGAARDLGQVQTTTAKQGDRVRIKVSFEIVEGSSLPSVEQVEEVSKEESEARVTYTGYVEIGSKGTGRFVVVPGAAMSWRVLVGREETDEAEWGLPDFVDL